MDSPCSSPLAAGLRWSLLQVALLVLIMSAAAGCSHPPPPESLVELRRIAGSPAMDEGREAAPDLVAEAQRSLQRAEASLAARDQARARWMAALGTIQARIAVALARQQAAESRIARSSQSLTEVEEDINRYRSQREDALRELERLEELRGGGGEEGDEEGDGGTSSQPDPAR